jgi:hypothetical protein
LAALRGAGSLSLTGGATAAVAIGAGLALYQIRQGGQKGVEEARDRNQETLDRLKRNTELQAPALGKTSSDLYIEQLQAQVDTMDKGNVLEDTLAFATGGQSNYDFMSEQLQNAKDERSKQLSQLIAEDEGVKKSFGDMTAEAKRLSEEEAKGTDIAKEKVTEVDGETVAVEELQTGNKNLQDVSNALQAQGFNVEEILALFNQEGGLQGIIDAALGDGENKEVAQAALNYLERQNFYNAAAVEAAKAQQRGDQVAANKIKSAQDQLVSLEDAARRYQAGAITPKQYADIAERSNRNLIDIINTQAASGEDTFVFLEQLANVQKTQAEAFQGRLDLLDKRNEDIKLFAGTSFSDVVAGQDAKNLALATAAGSDLLGAQGSAEFARQLVQGLRAQQAFMMQAASSSAEVINMVGENIKLPAAGQLAFIKSGFELLGIEWNDFNRDFTKYFGESAGSYFKAILESSGSTEEARQKIVDLINQVKAKIAEEQARLTQQYDLENLSPEDAKAIQDALAPYMGQLRGLNQFLAAFDISGVTDEITQDVDAAKRTLQARTSLSKAQRKGSSIGRLQDDLDAARNGVLIAMKTVDNLDDDKEAEAAFLEAERAYKIGLKAYADKRRATQRSFVTNILGDDLAAATLELQQANEDLAFAIADEDENAIEDAKQAQYAATKAIRDIANRRQNTFAQILKAMLGEDPLLAANADVNIARMQFDQAVGPDAKLEAFLNLLNAEKAAAKALIDRKELLGQLDQKRTQDPLAQATIELNLAKDQEGRAKTEYERIQAELRRIDAERAVEQAMQDMRDARFNLRTAELNAIEDSVGTARIDATKAREALARAVNNNMGQAAIDNARAGVVNAEKAARDAVFQNRMDDYKFLLDMGEITQSQYADYLESLKSTLIPGTKQFKDLEVTIKQLRDDIGGNLQSNLPTSLQLPTLYEVRRLNQTGQNATPGQSIGYQDNKNVQVTVYVNNGMSQGQVVDTLAKAMNVGTTGLESKRY